MRSHISLILLSISARLLPSLAASDDNSSRKLRRAVYEASGKDPSPADTPSRSLFEEFASYFYESMDALNKEQEVEQEAEVEETSPPIAFSDQLEMYNISFFTSLTTSRGDSKGAFYYMEWLMTGSKLGCGLLVQPHIKLQCTNGGRINADHPCIVQNVDTAVCMHEVSAGTEYMSRFMGVWCTGNEETELGLTVQLAGGEAACYSANGRAAQGISLGQACGAFGSEDFQINIQESNCGDPSQFLSEEAVDDNPMCMAFAEASQDNLLVGLPVVNAAASPSTSGGSSCIYDIDA